MVGKKNQPKPATVPEPQLHNRIAVLRAERGVSRRDLAEAVDVHYQTIGYLERSEYNPSLTLALRIAGFFSLPVEAVFSLRPLVPLSHTVFGRPTEDSPAPPKDT